MMGIDPPQALDVAIKDESPRNRAAAIAGIFFCRQGLDSWVPRLFQLAKDDIPISLAALTIASVH